MSEVEAVCMAAAGRYGARMPVDGDLAAVLGDVQAGDGAVLPARRGGQLTPAGLRIGGTAVTTGAPVGVLRRNFRPWGTPTGPV
ncbi:hypothetical protein AB0G79_12205 [Streptomyces sp. NPDC020807]|uniref:hypothetical protein n=1 Tax=Streptomyces sp. NPDC020807 TaxID=3155119 RepID=UPI0033C2C148